MLGYVASEAVSQNACASINAAILFAESEGIAEESDKRAVPLVIGETFTIDSKALGDEITPSCCCRARIG